MSKCQFCSSLDFYLDILKATLRHNRYDSGLVRTAMDNIGSMLNGYVSVSRGQETNFSGNWAKFKTNSFATKQALNLPSGQKPHMEHVVPIRIIWKELIQSQAELTDLEIICTIVEYLIPCLITDQQRAELDSKFKSDMPPGYGLRDPGAIWSRYKHTETQLDSDEKDSLLSQVVRVKSVYPIANIDCVGDPSCLTNKFKELKCT